MIRSLRTFLLVACLASMPVLAHADSTTILPQYNGPGAFIDPGPYQPPTIVGSFLIDPGNTSITISGTFGNATVGSSAGVDLFLGSILVGQCIEFASCYNNVVPWSTTLSPAEIASLGVGSVNFTAVQTSQVTIRLGETTLTQINSTAPVPEPSTLVLLATGALTAAGAMRRRLLA